MSATFPADVFTATPVWISGPAGTDDPFKVGNTIPGMLPGCYISMNREDGMARTETVHECGLPDWACPVGVALELEQGEADADIPETIEYDEWIWTIVSGPNEAGYYHLNHTERTATGACGHVAHVHGDDLGLPTL